MCRSDYGRTRNPGRAGSGGGRDQSDAGAHDLRHSFATQLSKRSNGNVVMVAQLMGHASTQTTQRYLGFTPATASLVEDLYESPDE